MRLTRFTDYALRVLMFLAADEGRLRSIQEISAAYGISHNHLTKVVHDLGKSGFVTSVRGRNGGIRLSRPADEILVGDVVRSTEDGFQVVDCANCIVAPGCGMATVLAEAVQAFLAVLDRYSLADLPKRDVNLASLFALPPADAPPREPVARKV